MNALDKNYDFGCLNKNDFQLPHNRPSFLKMSSFFDEDYFSNGRKSGKSLYENYRWLPALSKPLAQALEDFVGFNEGAKLIDYGCARGYLVRALVERGLDCFGIDVSEYAIKHADTKIRNRLTLGAGDSIENAVNNFNVYSFDYMLAKDVFEHIHPTTLTKLLRHAHCHVQKMYVLVPLGDNGVYRINEYEKDKSHVVAENEDWWANLFESNGFRVKKFEHKINGLKDYAYGLHKEGNGHFILDRV
jgi:cyclopropane fatty-acyl-phospholipid synthase-like methyltransferase